MLEMLWPLPLLMSVSELINPSIEEREKDTD